jgi:hypothetical protein
VQFRTTLRLLIAVLLTAVVLWVADRRWVPDGRRPGGAERLSVIPMDDVVSVLVEQGEQSVTCERAGEHWFIVRPVRARAAPGVVERLLSVLEMLPRRETVTGVQRRDRGLTLADYGLDAPRARLVLCAPAGRDELLVGADAPLGHVVYVRFAGHDAVIGTSRDLLDVLPADVEAWRDRRLIAGNAGLVRRLDVHRAGAGFMQIARRDGAWWIEQPVSARVDAGRVDAILDAVLTARVRTFVWDAPADGDAKGVEAVGIEGGPDGRLAPYGLLPEEAAARVAVWLNGDHVGREIILGKPAGEKSGEVYAKRRDWNSIVTVDAALAAALDVSVSSLRVREVFSVGARDIDTLAWETADGGGMLVCDPRTGWQMLEPVRVKADDPAVEALLQSITAWRVVQFEPDRTALTANPGAAVTRLTLHARAANAGPEADAGAGLTNAPTLLLGEPDGAGQVPAAWEGQDAAFRLEADSLLPLREAMANPLVLRDRTLLALPSRDVVRISLQRGAETETIARGADGSWAPADGAAGRVDPARVDAVLFAVANLRAVYIEHRDRARQADYGLDPPAVLLTFGLAGEAGIRKTVALGLQAGADGRYAAIQGQDVVFVLDGATAAVLCRGLLTQDEGSADAPGHAASAD